MTWNRFTRETLTATPWKNGGGVTREIASWPPQAGLDSFGWRLSIATIAQAGPFSAFAQVDRHIMLLDGDGVRLFTHDGRIDHRLDVAHRPFAFSGDEAIDCTLLGGTSNAARDNHVQELLTTGFDVLRRRDAGEHILVAQSLFEPPPPPAPLQFDVAQGDNDPPRAYFVAGPDAGPVKVVASMAEAKKAPPKKAAPPKKPKGQWTVQAGAFKSKDQAKTQMGAIKKRFAKVLDESAA